MTAIANEPLGAKLLAPPRHTLILIVGVLLLGVLGVCVQIAARAHPANPGHAAGVVPLYLSLLAAEWGLFAFVRGGLRRGGSSVWVVVGRPGARGWALDIAIGLLLWAVWAAISLAWSHAAGGAPAAVLKPFHSQGPLEAVLWVALSCSAGICEELAFRGYLQGQLLALSRNPAVAIAAQAVLFGIAHAYQGPQPVLRITAFGLLFGLVAAWRRNPRAGMVAHAMTDIMAGLF
ncbi:MAG: CPBP family intramembrane glutamic endopeptidase [Phenylobacterium sp.]